MAQPLPSHIHFRCQRIIKPYKYMIKVYNHLACSTRVASSCQFSDELLMLSHERRLYHHLIGVLHFGYQTLVAYSRHGIVVEVSSIRGLPADCRLLKHLGFNHMPYTFVFSTFVAFTFRFISTLRCSQCVFTSFQQFKGFWTR